MISCRAYVSAPHWQRRLRLERAIQIEEGDVEDLMTLRAQRRAVEEDTMAFEE